jgi:hypothetical protein
LIDESLDGRDNFNHAIMFAGIGWSCGQVRERAGISIMVL